MRLIPDCPHGDNCSAMIACCPDVRAITDPAGILAALAEAGVLKVEHGGGRYRLGLVRCVSPWKEAE